MLKSVSDAREMVAVVKECCAAIEAPLPWLRTRARAVGPTVRDVLHRMFLCLLMYRSRPNLAQL